MPEHSSHPASFRDPSGFVFRHEGIIYRQVNECYAPHYEQLMQSGLYKELTDRGLLIGHQEINQNLTGAPGWYKTLLPEQLDFVSNPEEWSPVQLQEAALCTLAIALIAISHGMILKDAQPRNIQFRPAGPWLIDSLSFEQYDPSRPWVAYRQFCECFLYPLYLHHYQRQGTHRTILAWPDGIPAGVVAKQLPVRSYRNLGVWLHVRLSANVSKKPGAKEPAPAFSQAKMLRLITHLESITGRLLTEGPTDTAWSDYYDRSILSQDYLEEKARIFRDWVGKLPYGSALDLGANDGYFSLILAEKPARVIAADADWKCVQHLHLSSGGKTKAPIHALCADIANPTPASGFMHRERASFTARAASDLVTALALIHHLVLGQNIPLSLIAEYFAILARRWLIIEFIPLTDEKAARLISRKSRYPGPYDEPAFESAFGAWFTIDRRQTIRGTGRILYLMRKKEG